MPKNSSKSSPRGCKALKVGHPLDPATEIGPLIHERHLAKVCSYFDVAKKDGATIAVGGKPHDGPGGGHYVQPTLVTGANANMRVAQEEVFGPFLTVIPFKDENDAIEIANGVRMALPAMSGPATWAARSAWRMRWRPA